MASGAEEFDTIDGGCQCSLVRYRVTFPRNGTKIFANGKQYPYANHCNCTTCGKSYSTLTHTSLNIPVSWIQFAIRVPYSPQSPTQPRPTITLPVCDTELPPSYAASSVGSSWGRRPSTSSTASASSSATTATVTSASSVSTGATWISSSSASSRPIPPQRGASFVQVETTGGCCTSANTPSLTAPAGPPSLSQMLPSRPAYYFPLAAEARRNPQIGTTGANSSQNTNPSIGGTTPALRRTSQVGGVENPYFPISSIAAGKKPAGPARLGETINPLAAVTPPAKQKPKPLSTLSSTTLPSYAAIPQLQQQPGVYLTPRLTVPWPYKEFSLTDDVIRGFCGYCGGGLLVRPACIAEEDGVIELAAGSLDDPEKILRQSGLFNSSIKACLNWNGDEERLRLLNEWGISLGEGR